MTGFLRRHRLWFVVGVAVVLALAVGVWTAGDDQEYPGRLDPQNPGTEGGQALARVLEDEGVKVEVVRSADELHDLDIGGATTVLVTSADQLAPSTLARLRTDAGTADVLLVDPPHHLVNEIDDGVERRDAEDQTTGSCSDARFDDLTLVVDTASSYDATSGCFPSRGGYVLARTTDLTYFGGGDALTNDQVLRGDNAAVALRLLGADGRLVWYVPTFEDAADGEAVSLWTFAPDWLEPSLWLAGIAGAALLLWRARRFGPLATEPLPVVVRAVETTRSRGRMYRRADDRGYAASALRAAARRRSADHLRLGRGPAESEVVTAVADHLSRPEHEIGTLLADAAPSPDSDQALVRLAHELTELTREVRRG